MKLSIILMALFALASHVHAQDKKPLKVYILAGQSNMTGIVASRTLEHVKMFPNTAKEFADLFDAEGNPVILDDVRVTQWKDKDGGKLAPRFGGGKGERFGPDYSFGIYMHKALQEPILIIKTSQGGKDLNYHFRPPSAGTWTPPPGHPDLVKKEKKEEVKPPALPLPEKLDVPADFKPDEKLLMQAPLKHMGLKHFKGKVTGKVGGANAIHITSAPSQKLSGDPFRDGDLLLGVDGVGFSDDPVGQWRKAFHGSNGIDGDWMVTVTRWRKGVIETFDFDIAQTIDGGREGLAQQRIQMEKDAAEKKRQTGGFYRDMIAHVKTVLGDVGAHHPAYDPEAGYEIAGFVWFQGYNDLVNGGLYPDRDKPGGYAQYTWLLTHFIKDVRRDLGVPDLPFVVGVLGIGGIEDPPTSNTGHFQQAQAAVAEIPEFKGTVTAVHTGRYWDHQLAELDARSREVSHKKKDLQVNDGLNGEALEKAYAEYRAKHITAEEEEILRTAISNQGYHYFGSGKIMAGIGKGFAEAMLQVEKQAASGAGER